MSQFYFNYDNTTLEVGVDLGPGCRRCAHPFSKMTCGILILDTLFMGVTQFLSGAPLRRKILDPPLKRRNVLDFLITPEMMSLPWRLHFVGISISCGSGGAGTTTAYHSP